MWGLRRGLVGLLGFTALATPHWATAATFRGIVRDGTSVVSGAIVCGTQWDGTQRVSPDHAHCQTTGPDGAFSVDAMLFDDGGSRGEIVVAAPGFLTASPRILASEATGVVIDVTSLSAYPDNRDYAWWEAGFNGCGNCHGSQHSEWSNTAHARAATNPAVIQMFDGTDAHGNADVAPGYALDHRDAGDCAACHAPLAWWDEGGPVAIDNISDTVHAEGVNCEACHKVANVTPDGKGVAGSITLWRPPFTFVDGGGDNSPFAFGSFPDVIANPMRTSYRPERREGRFCGGCHQYTNRHGTVIMNTYEEWRSVGDTSTILQCQDCHMQDSHGHGLGVERPYMVAPQAMREESAHERVADDLYSHRFFSGAELASKALSVESEAFQQGTEIVVNVTLTNTGANHAVPTGMPFREFIVFVEAATESGSQLEQLKGPRIPDAGGDYAGSPGLHLARLLSDARGPTHEFWNATHVVSDTTLSLGETRRAEFAFDVEHDEAVTVTVRVIYRRFAQALADAKGWDTGDEIVLAPQHQLNAVEVSALCTQAPAVAWPGSLSLVLLAAWRRRRA